MSWSCCKRSWWTASGSCPNRRKTLIDSHRLRIEAKPLGVVKVDAGPDSIVLQFMKDPPIDPGRIIQLIQSRRNFKLSGQDRLRVEEKHAHGAERAQRVRQIFRDLTQPRTEAAAAK